MIQPKNPLILLTVAGSLTLIATTRAGADPVYTISDLGTLPGTTSSIATGINAQGQVVGVSYNSYDGSTYDSSARSFLYSNGQLSQANPLGGGVASSITNTGVVVGIDYGPTNDSGEYVTYVPSHRGNLLHTSAGNVVDLGSFVPFAMNDSGQLSGYSLPYYAGPRSAPAIWSHGQLNDLSQALHTFTANAFAINNSGDVLVVNQTSDDRIQFFLVNHNGSVVNLTNLPGGAGNRATSLNDLGQVVGNAFLYENNQIVPLNSLLAPGSGWDLTKAMMINDNGQIVGQGMIGGQEHAFLMTPSGLGQQVPEPSLLAFAGLVAVVSAARAARRKPVV